MKKIIQSLLLLLMGFCLGGLYKPTKPQEEIVIVEEIEVKKEPEFLTSDNPKKHLKDAMEYYELSNRDIVMAQAILETGHFTSNVCLNYNNLFGLYDSRKRDYYRFNHWSESVLAYKKYIQKKYKPPEDYYFFLDRIGYAEDPNYVSKVKQIVKKSIC